MAEHYTSTTESEEQMRKDLGVDAEPGDAGRTPSGAVSLSIVNPSRDAQAGDEPEATSQPAAEPGKAAPATDKTAAPAEPAQPKPDADGADDGEVPARFQKRINKLVRERGDEKRRGDAMEERVRSLEAKLQSAGKPADQAPPASASPAGQAPPADPGLDPKDPEPHLEDEGVKDVEDYEAKHRAWMARYVQRTVDARLSAAREAEEKTKAEQKVKDDVAAAEQAGIKRFEAFKATHTDFDDVVEDAVSTFSRAMQAVILTDDHGPELGYYLAQHPEDVERINALDGPHQLLALGRLIETAVAAAAAPAPKAGDKPAPEGRAAVPAVPATPRMSSAPVPIQGVGGGSAVTAHEVTDESSFKDDEKKWLADLRAQTARR